MIKEELCENNLFVAEWSNTWGEYHGILGVFSSEEKAVAALTDLLGDGYRQIDGMVYRVAPIDVVTDKARQAYRDE